MWKPYLGTTSGTRCQNVSRSTFASRSPKCVDHRDWIHEVLVPFILEPRDPKSALGEGVALPADLHTLDLGWASLDQSVFSEDAGDKSGAIYDLKHDANLLPVYVTVLPTCSVRGSD